MPLINSVAIIESLDRNENHTGEALAQKLRAKSYDAVYTNVETQTQFLEAIQDAERRTRSLGEKVALHFEMHGTAEGFHLADGTLVPWQRVKRDIQNVNFAQKNHLIVSMAVCRGLWLAEIISAIDTSPFHSLVASEEDLPEVGIERGFPVFYERLFEGDSLEDAVHQLSLAQNGQHPDYEWITSEEMFSEAYQRYLAVASSPGMLEQRGNAVFDQFVRMGTFTENQRRAVLDLYLGVIRNEELPNFEEYRAKFFMHEAYPENMAVFCPSYDELVADRPHSNQDPNSQPRSTAIA